ncbi:unnamed protein product, partial [marine sediment metagenome]
GLYHIAMNAESLVEIDLLKSSGTFLNSRPNMYARRR